MNDQLGPISVDPRPKAIATGVLFDGLADCYVLDDGRRILSQRGVLRALSGGAPGSPDFARFIERLPKTIKVLEVVPVFFVAPGGMTHGVTSSTFVDILQAYVDAAVAGTLHAQQRHLAVNAQRILRALTKLGIDALVDEATGYQGRRGDDALSKRFKTYLRDTRAPHQVTWKEKLVVELARLYGHPYHGGRMPRFLASVYDKVYRIILADDIVDELKARNPRPRMDHNHHQYIQDDVKPLLRDDLEVVYVLARTSKTVPEFWHRVGYHFNRTPMQLALAGEEKSS